MPDIILARELSRDLGIHEAQLRELANDARLPFAVSGTTGFYIRRDDLEVWRAHARRKRR
jgi:hypothetical protein